MNNQRTVDAFGRSYSITTMLQALANGPLNGLNKRFVTKIAIFVPNNATKR